MPHFVYPDKTEVSGTSHAHCGPDNIPGTIVSRRILSNAVAAHSRAMGAAKDTDQTVREVADEDGHVCNRINLTTEFSPTISS